MGTVQMTLIIEEEKNKQMSISRLLDLKNRCGITASFGLNVYLGLGLGVIHHWGA